MRVFSLINLFLVLSNSASWAGTATTNLTVNVTIVVRCNVTCNRLSFGSRAVQAANTDQIATIGVTRTNGTSVTTRQMPRGATHTEYVNYSLDVLVACT
jgi:spore coat protein U-like protein